MPGTSFQLNQSATDIFWALITHFISLVHSDLDPFSSLAAHLGNVKNLGGRERAIQREIERDRGRTVLGDELEYLYL